jgi:protein ImuA
MQLDNRAAIFSQLQSDILRLQRFCPSNNTKLDAELGSMLDAFPNKSFPLGAVHEFLSDRVEDATATSGFVGGLISSLMKNKGTGIWISASRTLFPPALKMLGIVPEQFIFLDLKNEKDVLWAMDEALKCAAITTVVGEIRNIDFTQSRRLQLAVEQSQCTGFILRHKVRNPGTTACVSRWKITSLPSETLDDLPGIGYPGWKVELLRMRNGKPGSWNIQWKDGAFVPVHSEGRIVEVQHQKAG